MQLKQYEIVSRVEFFKCDIQEVLKSKKTIKKWAYILHDKDDTAPHYHIYVNFGRSGVDSKVVADWFGLQESQVNKIQGRSSDMELYLIHGNDSQQQKHQYDPSEVIANYDFKSSLTNAKILGNFTDYSFAQQLLSIGGSISSLSRLTIVVLHEWAHGLRWYFLASKKMALLML